MIPEEKRITTRSQLKEYLSAECTRYPMSPRRWLPYLFQISEGAILRRHTVLLRKTEYYLNSGRRLRGWFYHMLLMKFQNTLCIHVPLNSCGKGLWIYHVFPLCMNGNATVGEYCRIMPNVNMIGDDEYDYAPTVGDHVTLGINSTLVVNITLADGITVGAGSVVTKSFLEPGITIAGVPARKISDPRPGADADVPGGET